MVRTFVAALLFLTIGCGKPSRSPAVPPPPAEFLVATQDSTFWLTSGAAGIRFRGAPFTVATIGGRFYEIFVADDDRSYPDALLVGTRVYRRDLVDGDSILIYEDTIVPRIAHEYARTHPGTRPLDPDEEEGLDPATQATSDVQFVGLHGPYLSYEYHVDVAAPRAEPWHATRRGVIDLRSGRVARVEDLFPDSAARILKTARREFRAALDSLRQSARIDADTSGRAQAALTELRFDPGSFILVAADSDLAVEFDVPERGSAVSDDVLPLPSITVKSPPWWNDVRSRFPEVSDELDRWHRFHEAGYDVLARYDSSNQIARLSLSDTSRHEWPIRAVATPILHMLWLDHPPIDSGQRRALARAFDEATLYDESTRTVRDSRRVGSLIRLAARHHPRGLRVALVRRPA